MKKKYSKEYFSEIVKNSYSIADVLRKLELCPIGGSYKTVHKYIELYDLDTSHFTGMRWNKGLKRVDKSAIVKLDEILKENTSYKSAYLKERLIKEGPSITDAEETLNISGINKCLSGKRRSSGGFIWRYKK